MPSFQKKDPAYSAFLKSPQSDPAMTAAYSQAAGRPAEQINRYLDRQQNAEIATAEMQTRVNIERERMIADALQQAGGQINDAIITSAIMKQQKHEAELDRKMVKQNTDVQRFMDGLKAEQNYRAHYAAARAGLLFNQMLLKGEEAGQYTKALQYLRLRSEPSTTERLQKIASGVIAQGDAQTQAQAAQLQPPQLPPSLGGPPASQPAQPAPPAPPLAQPQGAPPGQPPGQPSVPPMLPTQPQQPAGAAMGPMPPAAPAPPAGPTPPPQPTSQPARQPARQPVQGQTQAIFPPTKPAPVPVTDEAAALRKQVNQLRTPTEVGADIAQTVQTALEHAESRQPLALSATVPVEEILQKTDFTKGMDGLWEAMTNAYQGQTGRQAIAAQNIQSILRATIEEFSGDKPPAKASVPIGMAAGVNGVVENLLHFGSDWFDANKATMTPPQVEGFNSTMATLAKTHINLVAGPLRQVMADANLQDAVNNKGLIQAYLTADIPFLERAAADAWAERDRLYNQWQQIAPAVIDFQYGRGPYAEANLREIGELWDQMEAAIDAGDLDVARQKRKEWRRATATADEEVRAMFGQ